MTIERFSAKCPDGSVRDLSDYAGRVLLIVNVASQCGFTVQYSGLEALYRRYREQGLVVLGFPCNQFGHQEPGNAVEISNFCSLNYEVTFPVFSKIEVNGPDADPLYLYLKGMRRGILGTRRIKWNFTKFLINRSGVPVARYAPMTKPEALEQAIQRLL